MEKNGLSRLLHQDEETDLSAKEQLNISLHNMKDYKIRNIMASLAMNG